MHLPFYSDAEVVETLLAIMRLHRNNPGRTESLHITIEPSSDVCESDPETAVFTQGMELLKILN